MLLRRKIVISNVLMVVIPVVLTIAFWLCYAGTSGSGITAISRSSSDDDYLSAAQGALTTLEAGLSRMSWEAVQLAGDEGPGMVLVPNGDALAELEEAGFHLQVEAATGLLFSNADEGDEQAIAATRTESDGSLAWFGSRLVIQDSFSAAGMRCHLFAVYDEARADSGVVASLVPVYAATPGAIALVVAFAVLVSGLTAFVLTRWLDRSVAEPLHELRAAAERVEAGDLDRRIAYPKQDEFGEVCDAFDGMRKRLKQADVDKARYEEERREMLQGVSHDLRSPLTSIVGYASGIKDGIADTPEKRGRYCDAILTRAGDLERMVESLSVLTRAEGAGVLRLERLVLGEFVSGVVEDKRAWLESKAVSVQVTDSSGGAEVMADADELRRVFDNLFVNTVRHRERTSSCVTLALAIEEGFSCVRYADDGPGVPERHLGRIFESFYRADESRTRPGEGSGLGLAIVQRIVADHGGSVSAENDEGLAVTIRLPLAEGSA